MRRNPLVWLSETLLTLTSIPVIVMMVHVTLDVFLKYVFHSPIQGTLEIVAYYYMVAVVVMPLAFVEYTRQSIAVDLFYQMMPHWIQGVSIGLVLLLSAASYGGLAYVSWPDAFHALEINEIVMGSVNVPIWPARFLLPITLTLTCIVCIMLFFALIFNKAVREELTSVHDVDTEAGLE